MKYGIIYSVLLIGLLGACGRAPQTTVIVPQPKVGDTLLTEQYVRDNLQDYGKWLASTLVNSIRSSGFEMPTPAALTAQQVSVVCGFEESPDFEGQDDDQDTVYENYLRSFVECEQDKGTYIEVKNGQFQIEDVNDNNPESGLRSRATDLIFDFYDRSSDGKRGNQQLKIQDTWDFSIVKSDDSGSLAYVLTMIGTKYENNQAGRAIKGTLALAGSYRAGADAVKDSNDYDNGVIGEARGELTLDDKAAFNTIIKDLEFVDTCKATPVKGSLSLNDGTNTFSLEFSGCETVSYVYNGVAISTPVVE